MNRPRKKEYGNHGGFSAVDEVRFMNGWNSCCDEWEAYLPSEKELTELLDKKGYTVDWNYRNTKNDSHYRRELIYLAKAISERLRR